MRLQGHLLHYLDGGIQNNTGLIANFMSLSERDTLTSWATYNQDPGKGMSWIDMVNDRSNTQSCIIIEMIKE